MCLYMFLIFTYAYVHGIYTHRYIIYICVYEQDDTRLHKYIQNTSHMYIHAYCTYKYMFCDML